jgi:hypothetical protein
VRTRTYLLFCVAYLILINNYSLGGTSVSVSGVVRTSSGATVEHAYVEAIPVLASSGGATVGNFPNPWVAADGSGAFTFRLVPGRYRLRAKDEDHTPIGADTSR